MHIGILQFPGSNCERETRLALQRVGAKTKELFWNSPANDIADCAGYVIVGGFSYEDRLRAGVIAALDPVMQIIKTQAKLGKPVFGICNGAQILVESGLVPGLADEKLGCALLENKRLDAEGEVIATGYYNDWVQVTAQAEDFSANAFTRYLKAGDKLEIPIAHAEGRFVLPESLYTEMQTLGTLRFYYEGQNPNGSMDKLAAISNRSGNVLAMMPHPERTEVGDVIFKSMLEYAEQLAQENFEYQTFDYQPASISLERMTQEENTGLDSFIVASKITDNAAQSVQTALQQLGFKVEVSRYQHWSFNHAGSLKDALIASTELFNPNKEMLSTPDLSQGLSLLVQERDQILATAKQQTLQHQYDIPELTTLKHGEIWHIKADADELTCVQDFIIKQHLLFNPYGHDCYVY